MKHEFAILPWEYRGSDYAPKPHALTSLDVGGHERTFLLKMRDGVIYFKEPKRPSIYAILRKFKRGMLGAELIEVWRAEMERENYGRFFWRTLNFLETPAATVIASIHRADFSGWICDAFHLDWIETPRHRDGKTLNVWKDDIGPAIWRAINRAKKRLFAREMSASERQPLAPHWVEGSEDELRHIFTVIMQLYGRCSAPDTTRIWVFYASNLAYRGGLFDSFTWTYDQTMRFSPALRHLRRLVQQQFVWVAMDWTHHIEPPRSASLREKACQCGPHWRGNYSFHTPSFPIAVPMVDSLSQHQRLELLLELRDWLEGKVSPRQSASWLTKALD